MIEVTAQAVLNYIVSRSLASEDKPLRLGNVDFWFPIPGFPVGLCYEPPTYCWDAKAVQNDINSITASYWEEMCAHLMSGKPPVFGGRERDSSAEG